MHHFIISLNKTIRCAFTTFHVFLALKLKLNNLQINFIHPLYVWCKFYTFNVVKTF